MTKHEIHVTPAGDRFRVDVRDAGGSTSHDVGVPPDYAEQLGLAAADEPRLVEESFRFLLEREPKESIMGRFDLPVIARYFPEYPNVIAQALA